MKTQQKISIVLIIIVCLTLILTACGGGRDDGEERVLLSATLSEFTGGVHAKQADEDDFSEVEVGLVIEEDGQVLTMDDGRARLDLPDETIVRVTPSSIFTLTALEESNASLKLDVGELFIILGGGSLAVDTPSGLAVVRGSYMSVSVDERTGEVFITCLEGECEAGNDADSVTLSAGGTALLKNISTAPESGIMSEEDVHWWLYNNSEAIIVIPDLGVTVVGDRVWEDANKNGIQDEGEMGVYGVQVSLYDVEGLEVATTWTSPAGLYVFTHIPAGEYYIIFKPFSGTFFTQQDAGSDDTVDSDVDLEGYTDTFTVGADANLSIDAGVIISGEEHPTGIEYPDEETTVIVSQYSDITHTMSDGTVVKARWTYSCPAKNVLIYLPWFGGDLNDWENYLYQFFPEDYPISVFAITYPGCEGGCEDFEPDVWLKGLKFALLRLGDLDCIDEEPNVVFMGASAGADYALWMCHAFNDVCKGVVALSPGGYVGRDLVEEVMILVEMGMPVFFMYGDSDGEVASDPVWPMLDDIDFVTVYKLEDNSEHGIFTLTPDTIQYLLDFLNLIYGLTP